MRERVEEVFKEIRAILQADGSDAELVEVGSDGIVKFRFIGACGTCGGSMNTLRKGVERMVKEKVPEVREVTEI